MFIRSVSQISISITSKVFHLKKQLTEYPFMFFKFRLAQIHISISLFPTTSTSLFLELIIAQNL